MNHSTDACPLIPLLANRGPAGVTGLAARDIDGIADRVAAVLEHRDHHTATRIWLDTKGVQERTAISRPAINRAANDGELHGHQARAGGRWRFHIAAVDAWIADTDQEAACGCRNHTTRPARRGARR